MPSISEIHDRVEAGFAAWGRLMVRRRWLVIGAVLALSGALVSFLPELRVDNSIESFLRPGDPARRIYDDFRARYGQDDAVLVAVEPPDVFDLDFLTRLREFHAALEAEVPYAQEVTSLVNARNTRGDADRLVVEELLERWPGDQAALDELKSRVLANELYRDWLIDRTGRVTAVVVRPNTYSVLNDGGLGEALAGFEDQGPAGEGAAMITDTESRAMVLGIKEVMARFQAPDFRLHVAGGAVGNQHSTDLMMRDVKILLSSTVAAIAALLFYLFRSVVATVLPLVVVLLALLATLGFMALVDVPSSVSSQILPILLLTVGTCGAIHILAMVYRGLSEGRPVEEAISFALGHSGLAVLMASITTAAGLVSFSSARLAQVANLGTIAPVGVLLAFVYVVSLLPALLSFAPLRATRFGAGRDRIHRRISGVLARMGGLASARPRAVVAVSGMLLAVAAIGISRVHYSQYPMRWFPEGDVLRSDTEFIDAHLGGVDSLEIVVDTQERNGLHDPRFLEHLETAIGRSRLLANDAPINKSISILEVVKETHRALNENRESFYAVPDDRRLLAQELLLFENSGSDDLEEWTDSQFRTARVSLRLPAGDAMRYPPFIAALERVFREQLGDGFDVEVTGLGALFGRTFAAVNPTMGRSYTIALLIITPLMVLLIGNLRGGLVAMIPNLIPVFLTLGLMGALGIPLDNSSLLVGCIIIGLAVDDTIHFMHKFQRYFRETGNAADAVRRTLETTGSALLFTSLCLGAGFTTMLLAYMVNIVEFGMLALFATVVAFLADVVLAPALMVLVTRRAGASSPR